MGKPAILFTASDPTKCCAAVDCRPHETCEDGSCVETLCPSINDANGVLVNSTTLLRLGSVLKTKCQDDSPVKEVICSDSNPPAWKHMNGGVLQNCSGIAGSFLRLHRYVEGKSKKYHHLGPPKGQEGCSHLIQNGVILPTKNSTKMTMLCNPGFLINGTSHNTANVSCQVQERKDTPHCVEGCNPMHECPQGLICADGECIKDVTCPKKIAGSNGQLGIGRSGIIGEKSKFQCFHGYGLEKQGGNSSDKGLSLECSESGWINPERPDEKIACFKSMAFRISDVAASFYNLKF